jgi:hypothetical protein
MSLLEAPSTTGSFVPRPDELEDAFIAWIRDPAHPDVVELGPLGRLSMVDLSQRLTQSHVRLGPASAVQLGLCPDATFAAAAGALLHATVDPDGPRCRSFRAAGLYLRGKAYLEEDTSPPLDDAAGPPVTSTDADHRGRR